jgi:L-ascorbate metabolism protein UlaG (beta-lactamase superfamily)
VEERVYLKPNVMAEPLINNWYAWPYLIPPHTAAMYMANWHLKIMESFVSTPQVHVSALKRPEMIGGPFMDCPPNKTPAVKELIQLLKKEQETMIRLASAIKELDQKLLREAKGYSLESAYQEVPEILKGYVELVYDLNNQPSIRFIEGLLYKSPFYDPSLQAIELSLSNGDYRSFVFSTPRLGDERRLRIHLPFNHQGIDELFKMKQQAKPLAEIMEILGIDKEVEDLFSNFFTQQAPQTCANYSGEGVRLRYLGHACLLFETKSVAILCDPLVSYQHDSEIFRYVYSDLPEVIDYALITHNHQDHCMFETLLQLRHKIKNLIIPRNAGGTLVDPSLKLILKNIGFHQVYEIDEMETLGIDGGSITALPFLGEHADLNIRAKTAYFIRLNDHGVICAADSNNIEPMLYEHFTEYFQDVTALFLGMECVGGPLSWLYGPLLTGAISRSHDQSRRFDGSNYAKAIDLVERLKPEQVYVYAMGQEPWLSFLTSINYTEESPQIIESNKLINECSRRGLISERLLYHKEMIL